MNQALPRTERVRRRPDFERAYDTGVKIHGRFMTVFIALPVKLYAFLTMNVQGWLTRHDQLIGAEAQGASTLMERPRG